MPHGDCVSTISLVCRFKVSPGQNKVLSLVHMTLYMTVTLVNAAAASGNAGKIECWPCTSKYFATEDNWLKVVGARRV